MGTSNWGPVLPIPSIEFPFRVIPLDKNKRNYYRILHVQPDAPLALIRTSYRTLMQKLRTHPDLGGDAWDAAVLNEAYAVLTDARRRREYDAHLFAERSRAEAGRQTSAQRSGDREACGTAGPAEDRGEAKAAAHARHHVDPADDAGGQARRTGGGQSAYGAARHCAFCGAAFFGVLDAQTDCASCASPLMRVRPLELEASCQRNIHRVPLFSVLTLHTAWPGAAAGAELHDLSPNGLQFAAEPVLAQGQRVLLRSRIFVAVAEIANRTALTASRHRYGARFITLRYHEKRGSYLSTSA